MHLSRSNSVASDANLGLCRFIRLLISQNTFIDLLYLDVTQSSAVSYLVPLNYRPFNLCFRFVSVVVHSTPILYPHIFPESTSWPIRGLEGFLLILPPGHIKTETYLVG